MNVHRGQPVVSSHLLFMHVVRLPHLNCERKQTERLNSDDGFNAVTVLVSVLNVPTNEMWLITTQQRLFYPRANQQVDPVMLKNIFL